MIEFKEYGLWLKVKYVYYVCFIFIRFRTHSFVLDSLLNACVCVLLGWGTQMMEDELIIDIQHGS